MSNRWLNTTEYPFTSHFFDINGQKLHFIDEGEGAILLFVHGTPSWSFDYRKIIKSLRGCYRCIAIDHIGFGLSSKPAQYDYSIENHCRTLERFILEKNLTNITLVVHDFGGPIGFHFALLNPERIQQLVVLNTWMWSSEDDPDYQKVKKILKSPLLPFLYLYLNFSPRFILPKSFGDHKLSKGLLKQYTQPFATKSQRYGTLAFARSLLNDQPWFEKLWDQREVIAHKRTLFLWGMKDPIIKPHYLDRFQSAFKNAETIPLKKSGHFPQEEEPYKVMIAIDHFLKSS